MEPSISIVVPIYNAEKYMKKCINSILSQTLKNIEIILVNDGSTDNCGKIIDEYADTSGNKKDGNQKQLQELIKNHDKYDLILVQSFNDIHWRTAKFCKVRHQIQRDIYSMHEEMYLKY